MAVVVVLAALSPRRVDPPPPVPGSPFGYVAICCARPVVIEELKR